MKILKINDDIATCEAAGVQRDVNLQLLADDAAKVGNFVLVHLGYAIQTVPGPDAEACWDAYDAMHAKKDKQQPPAENNNA